MFELPILSLVFTIIAMLSVWSSIRLKTIPLWLLPFAIAMSLGMIGGLLTPLALVWIAIALLGFYSLRRWPQYSTQILIPLGIYVLIMGMNLLPGFTKVQLLSPRLLGNSLHPFFLDFKLAKPISGLLLLAFVAQRCGSLRELCGAIRPLKAWLLPTLGVLAVGAALGLAIDVKFFVWTPVFIVCNLFFTVIAEEAFFRGLLQQPLHNRFGQAKWIIPVMALVFALVHIPPTHLNPIKFYAIIGAAGACYAWAYSLKHRIELSIASHTLLNTLHFMFFTYPLAF